MYEMKKKGDANSEVLQNLQQNEERERERERGREREKKISALIFEVLN